MSENLLHPSKGYDNDSALEFLDCSPVQTSTEFLVRCLLTRLSVHSLWTGNHALSGVFSHVIRHPVKHADVSMFLGYIPILITAVRSQK